LYTAGVDFVGGGGSDPQYLMVSSALDWRPTDRMALWFKVAAQSFQSARFEGSAGRGGGTNRARPGPAVSGGGAPVVVVLAGGRVPGS
jgi:hypothetical protein